MMKDNKSTSGEDVIRDSEKRLHPFVYAEATEWKLSSREGLVYL